MTRTIEAIKVMQAYVEGKDVEVLFAGNWQTTNVPSWSWSETTYRIKPSAKLRPWTADEVPLGSIMRNSAGTRWLIVDTSADSKRHDWCCYHEHSTDGGVTWKPCGVVEEAK
jgi:hypothetical protein